MDHASSSSSSSHNQGAFHNYPQKYTKTQQTAKKAAASLLKAMQQGPQSRVALVVDTRFHLSKGYVLCQTDQTLVQVIGIPYGTVVPGMRLFVRQFGSHTTNRAYIFDGYAPNLSSLGTYGSVLSATALTTPLSTGVLLTSANVIASVASLTSSTGYYWHLFFYLPQLFPSVVTLFQFVSNAGTPTTLQLEYLPTGYLQLRDGTNHGYITNTTVAPHVVHWLLIQPGNTGNEFLLDGIANYTGLQSSNDEPVFAGGTTTYTLSYLSTTTGTNLAPLGSWVSKMGYGASYVSGTVIPLIQTVPNTDSQIPLLSGGSTNLTIASYLCEDSPGSTTIANGASGGSSSPLTLNPAVCTLQIPGPY